ncbi:hypothetical protein [Cupriavidus taiwanensis]|uniref:Oligogalacturonide lyase n=1 Tax=Cupriavidus taiwanensis TaxID=164546 RepID=A0A7Z7NQ18_9BURK|nr:hypothetical protein [Cupriavidus taiwanensis]SOZ17193.1 conserved hypothetical protein [Cupriavidus taiwanensis]SOZ96483.1 conserved hypothetical protein [Cupriavidus taiwanensis]SPC25576.1 conserved hypothetical protein [Cupriavidus taiwanensis]
MSEDQKFPCKRVGRNGKHHFFGYYNKSNWDSTGQYLLGQEVPWRDHYLTPDLVADIGYFDMTKDDGVFHRVGHTTTWNWQMGSQLQWLGNASHGAPRIIFNVRTNDSEARYPYFASQIIDVRSGEARILPMPVYVVAPNGIWALSVDYRRLYVTHETIGYPCDRVKPDLPLCPGDDGIWNMDLRTGATKLAVSYAQLAAFHPVDSMKKAIHWVSHIEVNPSSNRVLFLHRWTERVKDETCFLHRLITMAPDGSDMRLLECSDHPLPQLAADFDPASVGTFDYEKSEWQISHPLWRQDGEIIVWGPHAGKIHYHLYQDRDGGRVDVVGDGVLTENGHMTFSPVNPRWLLSDTYPDSTTNERILFLFDMETGKRHDLGSFYADPKLSKENRCDLHPRWAPDGKSVCIDSVHEHDRDMYVIDVSSLVGGGAQ